MSKEYIYVGKYEKESEYKCFVYEIPYGQGKRS